ncbi:hypothetical protein COCNU_contig69473892G000010 [Cocos nucifera]|nr:hypothetical protein [Cocos nucifera]
MIGPNPKSLKPGSTCFLANPFNKGVQTITQKEQSSLARKLTNSIDIIDFLACQPLPPSELYGRIQA